MGRGRGDPEHLVLHPVLARGIFLHLVLHLVLASGIFKHLVLHLVLARGIKVTGGNKRGNDRLWATRKRESIASTGLGTTSNIRPRALAGSSPKGRCSALHLVLHRVLARGILEDLTNKRWGGLERASRKRRGTRQATGDKRRGGPRGLAYKRLSKRRGGVSDNLGPPCT